MILRFEEKGTRKVEELWFANDLIRSWGPGRISSDGPTRPQVRIYDVSMQEDTKYKKVFGDWYDFKRYSSHWNRGTEEGKDCMYFHLAEDSKQGFLYARATYVWNPEFYWASLLMDDGKTYQRLS